MGLGLRVPPPPPMRIQLWGYIGSFVIRDFVRIFVGDDLRTTTGAHTRIVSTLYQTFAWPPYLAGLLWTPRLHVKNIHEPILWRNYLLNPKLCMHQNPRLILSDF